MANWSELMHMPLREICIGGSIVFGSGASCALDGEKVFSLSIDEGADGALSPGSVISASCTLDLVNDQGQWNAGGSLRGQDEWIGAVLMPRIGARDGDEWIWHDLGVFIVESAAHMEEKHTMRLKGQDSIASELSAAFADDLVYPQTLSALWKHAVGQSRFAWQGTVPNGSAVITAAPDWKGASLRGVMGYIAAAAGCFVQADRQGSLQLKSLWNADAAVHAVDPECYLSLSSDDLCYGPVDALQVTCTDDETTKTYLAGANAGLYAVQVRGNPLFRSNDSGLNDLAAGMLECIAGFNTAALQMEWRGDPALCIGDHLQVADLDGSVHAGVVSRQSLRYDGTLSSSCSCDVPEKNNSGVQRAITPEGRVNAAALIGAVDGALLRVGSVSTEKLSAGSVTAEKIAAGAVDAQALQAVTAKIESLQAGDISTDRLAAALAAFTVVTAGTAEFDRATAAHLVAHALNLEFGAAEDVFIRNLKVVYAQLVSAAIGNLCIRASDGNYYAIDVDEHGNVTAAPASLTDGEISAGETGGGRVILQTDITAESLNTASLLATYALVNKIDASRIDVDALWARQAFIAHLQTADISSNGSIMIIADKADAALEAANAALPQADFQRVVRIDESGLHVGDNQSAGEVLIDSDSVNVAIGGRKYSRFAGNYVQFGNYQLRQSVDGGLVFKLREA